MKERRHTVTLRDYFEQRLRADRELAEERWLGHKREAELIRIALDKAEHQMQIKMLEVNNVRSQIDSERGLLAAKSDLVPLVEFKNQFLGIMMAAMAVSAIIGALLSTLFSLLMRFLLPGHP